MCYFIHSTIYQHSFYYFFNRRGADFLGVVRFCVTADENVNDFYEFVADFDYGPTWRSVLDRYLNEQINENSGEICCPQPIQKRVQAASMERSHVTVKMYPVTNLTINGSNISVALMSDDPWGYQAIFFNIPTVTGDIAMLLLIIIVLTALVGILLWCSQHYLLDPQTSSYDEKACG